MKNNSFVTICPYCGTPISCDNALLNKEIQCIGCEKLFTAKQKEYCNDERYKLLNQIMKKSEFIGQWELYLNQVADKQNPKYSYWQGTYENLKKERKKLYDKLLSLSNIKVYN